MAGDSNGEGSASGPNPLPRGRNPIPFRHPVVLRRLFDLCDLSELRNFRLVCKEWDSLILSRARKERTVRIYQMTHDEHCWSDEDKANRLQWATLGNKLDVGRAKPFRSFNLNRLLFADYDEAIADMYNMSENLRQFEGMTRNMERFWDRYGSWIHKLEMHEVHIRSLTSFKRAIFEKTPNLQELTLSSLFGNFNRYPLAERVGDDEADMADLNIEPQLNLTSFRLKTISFPFSWNVLFAHFPNIQKLDLAVAVSPTTFIQSLEQLSRNRHRTVGPITHLRSCAFEESEETRQLLELPVFNLKMLDLDVGRCDSVDFTVLPAALRRHGSTLKELTLVNVRDSAIMRLQQAHHPIRAYDNFPYQADPFPSLTKLALSGIITKNFHFLEQLPNLKSLEVDQFLSESMLEETDWNGRLGNLRMTHLQEFRFVVYSMVSFCLPEEVMKSFVKIMPNVVHFSGQLGNSALRVICSNWKELRKLEIVSGREIQNREPPPALSRVDDVGVTGIVPGSEDRLPAIVDLQNLRLLTLEHMVKITDSSVHNGLLKLPYLSSLNICVPPGLSAAAVEALKERLASFKTHDLPPCTCDTCPIHHPSH